MTKKAYGREQRPSKEVKGFRENHENWELIFMLKIAFVIVDSALFLARRKKRAWFPTSVLWTQGVQII